MIRWVGECQNRLKSDNSLRPNFCSAEDSEHKVIIVKIRGDKRVLLVEADILSSMGRKCWGCAAVKMTTGMWISSSVCAAGQLIGTQTSPITIEQMITLVDVYVYNHIN